MNNSEFVQEIQKQCQFLLNKYPFRLAYVAVYFDPEGFAFAKTQRDLADGLAALLDGVENPKLDEFIAATAWEDLRDLVVNAFFAEKLDTKSRIEAQQKYQEELLNRIRKLEE